MFQRSDSASHPDSFAISNTLFVADSLRDGQYRSSIDDPLPHTGNIFAPPQYQSSTSFSSRNRHGSIGGGGGLSHTMGPLYLDANTSSYATTTDLYPKSQSLLPTLSEGVSYEYDSSTAPRNLIHQQPFGPVGLGGSVGSGSASLLPSSFGAVPNASQPLLNAPNAVSGLHQSMMTQQHLLQHPPPSQQPNATGLMNQYSVGGLHQPISASNSGVGSDRMVAQLYNNAPSFNHLGPVPPNNSNGNNGNGTHSASSNPTQANGQEEISTIFVVGFPDDMQEREFQNMFTFSHGFEAATLKIPNKESTSYGVQNILGATAASTSLRSGGMGSIIGPGFAAANGYAGAADPYNLVTVNSGGVVLDSRDLPGPTTTAAWPGIAADDGFVNRSVPTGGTGAADQGMSIPSGPNAPPRKQIIGFAKFATRADAIVARDMLQSKRVDVEKGAVLKAEMAKKNLHTKRGVGSLGTASGPGGGPMPGNNPGGGGIGHNVASSLGGPNGFSSLQPSVGSAMTNGASSTAPSSATPVANGDSGSFGLTQRERDSAAIAAMGLGGGPKNRQDVEREREYERDLGERDLEVHTRHNGLYDPFRSTQSISGSSTSSSSAPRWPPIPDEFSNAATPTANTSLSVPSGAMPHSSPVTFNGRTTWTTDADERSSGSLSPSSTFSRPRGLVPGREREREKERERERYAIRDEGETTILASNQYSQSHNDSRPASPVRLPTRPPSAAQSRSTGSRPSPEHFAQRSFSPHPEEASTDATNSAWPVSNQSSSYLTTNPPSSSRGGSSSPPDPNCQALEISQSQSTSRTGAQGPSESGDSGSLETRMTEFSIHPHRESSPQLPSPGSGGTGPSGRANAADQNPPINTLYVGNLPTTSATSTTNVLLEENLRLAFSRCPGYRKLCFRQKSNGPMCFVEFDDVSYATKALNDMYGHTLNGLIKNGIRLSYSKNPLGVRSPSLSNGSTGPTFGSGYHTLHDNGRFMPKSAVFGIEGTSRSRQDSVPDGRQASLSTFGFDNTRSSRQPSLAPEYIPEYVSGFGNHPSSPPSRYFSPTPGSTLSPPMSHSKTMSSAFGGLGGTGSGYTPGTTSTFSPFGNESSQPSSISQGDRGDSSSLSAALHNYQLDRSDGPSSLYTMPLGLGENRSHR